MLGCGKSLGGCLDDLSRLLGRYDEYLLQLHSHKTIAVSAGAKRLTVMRLKSVPGVADQTTVPHVWCTLGAVRAWGTTRGGGINRVVDLPSPSHFSRS